MEKIGFAIGIIGGLGLGLLIGSEFTGSIVTFLGAIFVIVSLIFMIILSYKEKK